MEFDNKDKKRIEQAAIEIREFYNKMKAKAEGVLAESFFDDCGDLCMTTLDLLGVPKENSDESDNDFYCRDWIYDGFFRENISHEIFIKACYGDSEEYLRIINS